MLLENRYVERKFDVITSFVYVKLDQGASAAPVHDDNIFVWNATIFGPSETCWEGVYLSCGLFAKLFMPAIIRWDLFSPPNILRSLSRKAS
jgi:hypothetical protein